jgi:hypothetical protein
MSNETSQPADKLSKERNVMLAILIVIVGYIFLAAPDPEVACKQNLRNSTSMTAAEIHDICKHAP